MNCPYNFNFSMVIHMEKEAVHRCYKCGEELVFEVKIGRRDTCPNCYAYLHSCKNCEFWDPHAHNECLEDQGEFIRDREEGNFCTFFKFRTEKEDTSGDIEDAKKRLQAMFGGKKKGAMPQGTPKTPEDAKARLEKLFKK
jgi:hypothetical protein